MRCTWSWTCIFSDSPETGVISPEVNENESLISKVIFPGTRAQQESHLWLQSLLLLLDFLWTYCVHAYMHAVTSVMSDSL